MSAALRRLTQFILDVRLSSRFFRGRRFSAADLFLCISRYAERGGETLSVAGEGGACCTESLVVDPAVSGAPRWLAYSAKLMREVDKESPICAVYIPTG